MQMLPMDSETVDEVGAMDTITSVMYSNSTLIGAVIAIGVLAYIGSNGISATHIWLRRMVAYASGIVLVVLGALAFYFGASKLLLLIYVKDFQFDIFRVEWTVIGALALVAGFALVRQAYRQM